MALHGNACLGCWEEDLGKSKKWERPGRAAGPEAQRGVRPLLLCFALQLTNPQEHPEAHLGGVRTLKDTWALAFALCETGGDLFLTRLGPPEAVCVCVLS